MPVQYAFDDRIVVIRMEGHYTISELEETVLEGLSDPARPAAPVLLFDLRASLTLAGRRTDDVRRMARFLVRRRALFGCRMAKVVSTDLAYGLMRLSAMTAETGGITTEVFRELAPARAWLLGEYVPDDGERSADPAPLPGRTRHSRVADER